jgi:hypothetical protein
MKELNYKSVHTMAKDEYDNRNFNFGRKGKILRWLLDHIGPGGMLCDAENKLWNRTLEYPGPGLISIVHHFKHQEDAAMFALSCK